MHCLYSMLDLKCLDPAFPAGSTFPSHNRTIFLFTVTKPKLGFKAKPALLGFI